MEPRLGRRGNQGKRVEVNPLLELQWSPGLVAGETRRWLTRCRGTGAASMEPRLGRRGNTASLAAGRPRFSALQWSPGLVAGETAAAAWAGGGPCGFNGAPAWSPGKPACDFQARHGVIASMEPRLGRRGNNNRRPDGDDGGFASMEPRLGRRGNTTGTVGAVVVLKCFNGAPAWSPGKPADQVVTVWTSQGFNGAPAWSPGKHIRGAGGDPGLLASMEPRLGRRGNGAAESSPVPSGRRFNGAPAWSPAKPA